MKRFNITEDDYYYNNRFHEMTMGKSVYYKTKANQFLDSVDEHSIPELFKVLAVLLIITCLFGVLSNPNFEFQGTSILLDTLENSPVVNMDTQGLFIEEITTDWLGFNWFRNFLNLFIKFFNLVIFTSTNLYNTITYVLYFVTRFFRFG